MIGFAAFIFILFAAVWGSVALGVLLFGKGKAVEGGQSDALLAAVREELDAVQTRLSRVEDDLSFFNELHRGDSVPRLSQPPSLSAETPAVPGSGTPEAASPDGAAPGVAGPDDPRGEPQG